MQRGNKDGQGDAGGEGGEVWRPPKTIEELYGETFSFGGMNSPEAGSRSSGDLAVGDKDIQLYSLATPNGQKVAILLEELGVEYDAHVIRIGQLEHFSKGFVNVNPNSKIPAISDTKPTDGLGPLHLFESGSIMIYLADKFRRFIPQNERKRAECLSWVMWQMANQGPATGNFGHFFAYAPPSAVSARDYGVARYGMEVQRVCSVINNHLAERKYICGDEYTIADMICFPWFQLIRKRGYAYDRKFARDFLRVDRYTSACAWADRLAQRAGVQRGMVVCRGVPKPWLSDDPRFERFRHLAKL